MGERLRTYRGPVTEIIRPEQRPSIIQVDNSFDPETVVECCEALTQQKQINYEFMLHGRLFRVRSMWASVCDNCGGVYTSNDVSKQIDAVTFRRLFPKETKIATLLEN